MENVVSSENGGTPGWFIMENPNLEMEDDKGLPLFQEPPNQYQNGWNGWRNTLRKKKKTLLQFCQLGVSFHKWNSFIDLQLVFLATTASALSTEVAISLGYLPFHLQSWFSCERCEKLNQPKDPKDQIGV